jgi:N-acetylmuramoyl-L-alanine amidase
MSKLITLIVFISGIFFLDSFCQDNANRFTIILDAGHGGKDPGAIGANVYEKQLTLEIADKVGLLLRQTMPFAKIIFTRTAQDEFVELLDRTTLANQAQADLFISIHCNASIYPKAKGAETYVLGFDPYNKYFGTAKRENSVILKEKSYRQRYGGFDPNDPTSYIILANINSAYTAQSTYLASLVEKNNRDRSRGVLQSGFIVLAHSAMPSILVETGYLTNSEDEAYLMSEIGQTEIATNICKAVMAYYQAIKS